MINRFFLKCSAIFWKTFSYSRRKGGWFHSDVNQAVQVGLACLLFVAPNSTPSSRTFSLVKSHLREFTKGAAFLPHSHHPNFLPNTGLQMSKFKSCFPGNNSNQWIAKFYGLCFEMRDYKYDVVWILTRDSACPRPSSSPPTLLGWSAPASYIRTYVSLGLEYICRHCLLSV